MTIQEPTQGQRYEESGARAAVATTLVSLVLLGAWLLWQLGHAGPQTATPPLDGTTVQGRINTLAASSGPSAPSSAAEGAPARGGMAETWDTQHGGASPQTDYVVGSEDAADRLRSELSTIDQLTASSGYARFAHRVVVVGAGRDATPLLSEEQQVRNVEDLPALRVVDLRPVGVPPTGPDGTFPIESDAPGFVP
jgi:hypothetical protein